MRYFIKILRETRDRWKLRKTIRKTIIYISMVCPWTVQKKKKKKKNQTKQKGFVYSHNL